MHFNSFSQKRGSTWMTEETLKFAISFVVILLSIFVSSLIKIFYQDTQFQQAKSTMEDIELLFDGLSKPDTEYYLLKAQKDGHS
jgi:hypothetical protein